MNERIRQFASECLETVDGFPHWKSRPAHHFSCPYFQHLFNARFAGKPAMPWEFVAEWRRYRKMRAS
jgi:hypothetical protein